jgi:NAD(P)-dependent dehydrogenase (short-subunit alcohol dehydrogenase family)
MSVFAPHLLAGKAALVTGGGSGIGAGIATLFARHGAGVTLVGRTQAKLDTVAEEIRQAGGQALAASADVREPAALEQAIAKTVETFGGLDILVNSAAGNFLAPAATLSPNGFRAVVDIDLCGTFNACRLAYPHLSARRGCIVSITAAQATLPMPLQAHAGAAKAGIEMLTRDLALEWGAAGVRVNAVAPGPVAGTEGMARLAPGATAEKIAKLVPLGRFGTIEEVAEVVLYLCSPGASWITGASFLVDGGAALLGAARFLEMMGG